MVAETRIDFNAFSFNGGSAVPAKPPSAIAAPGLVSIVVPCCGQLEFTKLCVASLLRHTREPFELIFLDIGSLDGTAEYLAGVATAAKMRIEVVHTPTDLGIGDACKEALTKAWGDAVVLLNNDTVVIAHWLDQMLALANTVPGVGLVGPMSNYAAPPQLVETVPYRVHLRGHSRMRDLGRKELLDLDAVNRFASEFRDQNRGKWMEVERLGGFCLLIKRAVLDKIGSLDSWSDLSLFDTDILSVKAAQAGFKLACARDLFIHHFGTRVFAHGAGPKGEERLVGAR